MQDKYKYAHHREDGQRDYDAAMQQVEKRQYSREQSANKLHQPGSDQVAHAFNVGHDAGDERTGAVLIVIADRKQPDMALDLANYLVGHGHLSIVVSNGGPLVAALEEGGSRHYCLPVHRKSILTAWDCVKALAKIIRDEETGEWLELRDDEKAEQMAEADAELFMQTIRTESFVAE